MAWELSITSAPRGLKPGSAGFCPVSHTRGMPPNLIERLETISGYRHLEIGSGAAARNPVVHSHTILRLSGETYYVLSRICDAGRDYSGRSNRFAYHLVLKPHELVPAGPAALLQVPGLMRERWDGQVCLIPTERAIPKLMVQPRPCTSWQHVLGDAGWAGVLAQKFLADSQKTIYFICPLEVDLLKLFDEVIALLPESHRWKVTFSTFDQRLGEVATCRWRAIPEHAPEASDILKKRGLEVWDLRIKRGAAPSVPEAIAAREGRLLELPTPQKVVTPVRDVTVTQPATPPVAAPSRTSQEVHYLELAESTDTPPPLWRASSQGTTPRKKRRPRSLVIIMNVVMLLMGLIIGLGTGFVLWSGAFIPPFLPGFVGGLGKTQVEDGAEKVPHKPDSEKPVRRQEEEHMAKEARPAEKIPPKKEAPGNNGEKPHQDTPAKPTEEKPTKPDQPKLEEPAGGQAPAEGASRQEATPNDGGQNSHAATEKPRPEDADAAAGENVAVLLDKANVSEIMEITQVREETGAPGAGPLFTWQARPLFSVENWDTKGQFAILKVVDREGQSRYYVRWPGSTPFSKTENIRVGTSRGFDIPLLQGGRLELRCVRGWRKGESEGEYLFGGDGRDRVRLKMEQATTKIKVNVESLDQDDSTPLTGAIAEIGFYVTEENGPRIWVPTIRLEIDTKAMAESQPRKRSQNGGIR